MLGVLRQSAASELFRIVDSAKLFLQEHNAASCEDLDHWYYTGNFPNPDMSTNELPIYIVYKGLLNAVKMPEEDIDEEIDRVQYARRIFTKEHMAENVAIEIKLGPKAFNRSSWGEATGAAILTIAENLSSGDKSVKVGHLRSLLHGLLQESSNLTRTYVADVVLSPFLPIVLDRTIRESDYVDAYDLGSNMGPLIADSEVAISLVSGDVGIQVSFHPNVRRLL